EALASQKTNHKPKRIPKRLFASIAKKSGKRFVKKIIVLLACVGLLGAFELQKPSYSFCNTSINY
ncbi:MAG: hypothetical protein PHS10_08110, partial [Thiovulaceae bacterium]|nr:hypothetical protein [Sulfurimonadaceae bacterium]